MTPLPSPGQIARQAGSSAADAIAAAGRPADPSGGQLGALAGSASALAIAGYLVAVIYQGNFAALGAMLAHEEPYLEFLAAIVALWAIDKFAPASPLTDMLIGGAILAACLKLVGRLNLAPLADFATGKASMVTTLGQVFAQHPAASSPAPGTGVTHTYGGLAAAT